MLSLIDTLIHRAESYLGYGLCLDIHIMDDRSLFPKKRDMAFTNGSQIVFSDKMFSLPIENQIALIAHEIAHCNLIQKGIDHSERDADRHAEEIFAFKISYDDDDIQTTGHGNRPRPNYLPK